jgi:FAD/FMN-containing dehydrogenase
VACELLDATFLRIAETGRSLPIAPGAECVLLIELESTGEAEVRARGDALSAALDRAGAEHVLLGLDPESAESLWAIRHAASPILARLDPGLRSMQVVEDACVPPERIAEFILGVRASLEVERLRGVIFGHAGDAHVHVNALVDVHEREWRARLRGLFERVTDLTARLGGTPSGEHGDGRLRTPVLDRFYPQGERRLFQELKAHFDPIGVLNPGVKTDAQLDPFDQVKYDPELPRLTAGAEQVLAAIERERGYDRCRMDLVADSGAVR